MVWKLYLYYCYLFFPTLPRILNTQVLTTGREIMRLWEKFLCIDFIYIIPLAKTCQMQFSTEKQFISVSTENSLKLRFPLSRE